MKPVEPYSVPMQHSLKPFSDRSPVTQLQNIGENGAADPAESSRQTPRSGLSTGRDVISRQPDQLALVVGDGIVAHTLVLLLLQAGYDPLFVTNDRPTSTSRVAYLWPAIRQVLSDIDDDPVECGTVVDAVSIRGRAASSANSEVFKHESSDVPRPVVASTSDLYRSLKNKSRHQCESVTRQIASVKQRENGLAVTFADGIQEWFDLVIDARTDSLIDESGPAHTKLVQYETTVERNGLPGPETRISEIWRPDVYAQYVPTPESEQLLRVTIPDNERTTAPGPGSEHQWVPEIGDDIATELTESEPRHVKQVRLADTSVETGWWGNGRTCFCGGAAIGLAPASGFEVSFGIESALSFVSTLTRKQSASDAVAAYATQRARRLQLFQRRTERAETDPYLASVSSQSEFETLGRLRRVALTPFLEDRSLSSRRGGIE